MNEMRKDRRAPASLKVKYKSATVDDFIEHFGGDVSRGGIFIKTKKPLDTGALLKFEFQLHGGSPLLHGVGRVAWRRLEAQARPDLPAGMGIKFIKLDDESRAVIDRIEARFGIASRFEQTEAAELAPPLSSLPPSLTSHGIRTPKAPANVGDGARTPIPSPPAPRADQPTFRPPPPATSSVPPALAQAHPSASASSTGGASQGSVASFFPEGSGPVRGVPSSVRSAARDSSEFLASAFSAGGAAHQVRSAARMQVERARRDPQSVDLAAELFGDLNEPSTVQGSTPPAADDAEFSLPDAPPPAAPQEGTLGTPSDQVPSLDALVEEAERAHPSKPERGGARLGPEDAEPELEVPLALSLPSDALVGSPDVPMQQTQSGGGKAKIVVVLLGLAAVAAGTFFFLRYQQAPGRPLEAVSQPGTQQQSTASAPSLPTAPAEAREVALDVSSEPRGARVSVDGKPAGKTPLTLELKSGRSVTLQVERVGFAAHTETITPHSGMPAKRFTLDALPYALVIRTDPPGATVHVGDASAVSPTPLELGHLDGMVTASVEKSGFQRTSRTIRLEDFAEKDGVMLADVSLSLSPLPGSSVRHSARRAAATHRSAPPRAPSPKTMPEPEPEPVSPVAQGQPAPEPEPEPEPEAPEKPSTAQAPAAAAKPSAAQAPAAAAKPSAPQAPAAAAKPPAAQAPVVAEKPAEAHAKPAPAAPTAPPSPAPEAPSP